MPLAPLDLSALEASVAEIETVDASAAAVITALLADVEAHKNDPVAIQALVDRARAATAGLAAAVANVPA